MKIREQMNIVVVGHVDHGKSTVIGRLLADTGSLPSGKLEQVKVSCERNARPFEYAFLLDALKDEQAQGITIDTARCFFKTKKRDYIIIDAPGHVEFLKNMVSGAARAEAALLVIDAHEGIRENSRRHGYLIAMLGIPQVVVLVNKMDLVKFDQKVFESIATDYGSFLKQLGVSAKEFIPISARDGDNLAFASDKMKWYDGKTVLDHVDAFVKQQDDDAKPFRMPVQDVYKFTEKDDERRIITGTIETGTVAVGDDVTFLPSYKKSKISTIEGFNSPEVKTIGKGHATGFTLANELYLPRGEIMCKSKERHPMVGSRFRANIFWMARAPMIKNKKYKLKIASARVTVRLAEVLSCIDATDLSSIQGRQQIDRHDVAECILETTRAIAFDTIDDIQFTGRFVIVDNYDIAGGGIITHAINENDNAINRQINKRELHWDTGIVTPADRQSVFGHKAKFIVITGAEQSIALAKHLESSLVKSAKNAYFIGPSSLADGLDSDVVNETDNREEMMRRLGELARILTDAGLLFITALGDADTYDLQLLAGLTSPNEFIHVSIGGHEDGASANKIIISEKLNLSAMVVAIIGRLSQQEILLDYAI